MKNKSFGRSLRVLMVPLAVLCIAGCVSVDPPEVALPSPPPNRPPVPSGSLAAQTLAVGQMVAVDVSPYFQDPDGDFLRYEVTSSARSRATATMGGSELRVTGLSAGAVSVTVTAIDSGSLSARLSFDVTVLPAVPVSVPAEPAPPVEPAQSAPPAEPAPPAPPAGSIRQHGGADHQGLRYLPNDDRCTHWELRHGRASGRTGARRIRGPGPCRGDPGRVRGRGI